MAVIDFAHQVGQQVQVEMEGPHLVDEILRRPYIVDPVESLHVVGALATNNTDLLTQEQQFGQHMRASLDELGVTLIGQAEHSFSTDHEQSGFTSVFGLAESHIAIHTWPELGSAEADVYLCNYLQDNRLRCAEVFDRLAAFFEPTVVNAMLVTRPRLALEGLESALNGGSQ